MLPAVVFSIFCLLLGLLNLIITIPLCYFVFWDQTKEYFIEFFEDELKKTMGQRKIDTPETIIMISIWMGIAVAIGLYYSLTKMPIFYFRETEFLFRNFVHGTTERPYYYCFSFIFFHSNSLVCHGRCIFIVQICEKWKWTYIKCSAWCLR